MIKTIFFDLDGTLLPMDYDTFEKGYFSLLIKKLMPLGFSKDEIINGVWYGTKAMMQNDGQISNEEVFWSKFGSLFKEKTDFLKIQLEDFYDSDFDNAISFCGFNPAVKHALDEISRAGIEMVVATNPIFPKTATVKRIKWAGLNPDDFSYISTYENSHYCKPNVNYYIEILNKLNLKPDEVIMVGNDLTEDLAAQQAGIKVFIIDDCLLNTQNIDINTVLHGNFESFVGWLKTNIKGR